MGTFPRHASGLLPVLLACGCWGGSGTAAAPEPDGGGDPDTLWGGPVDGGGAAIDAGLPSYPCRFEPVDLGFDLVARDVWGRSAQEIWVAGYAWNEQWDGMTLLPGAVLAWNGDSWSEVLHLDDTRLLSLTGNAERAVVFGVRPTTEEEELPLEMSIHSCGGASWADISPGFYFEAKASWAEPGGTALLAAGTGLGPGGGQVVLLEDGSATLIEDGEGGCYDAGWVGFCDYYTALAARSTDDVHVVGYTHHKSKPYTWNDGLYRHWDGVGWHDFVVPDCRFSDAWDLGDGGVLVGGTEYDPEPATYPDALGLRLYLASAGGISPLSPLLPGEFPRAVFARAPDDALVLTGSGKAFHYDGWGFAEAEVLPQEPLTGNSFAALWGNGEAVYAVVDGVLFSLVCP
jgi:hypothetical protein